MPEDKKNIIIVGLISLVLFALVLFFLEKVNKHSGTKESVKLNNINSEINITNESANLSYIDLSNIEKRSFFQKHLNFDNSDAPVPTNKWFSSIVFDEISNPIFSFPLAVKMEKDGFGLSYPQVVSTENSVFASYTADIDVKYEASLTSSVLNYDDLSVDITQNNLDMPFQKIKITRGSPFVFSKIISKNKFSISSPTIKISEIQNNFVLFNSNEKIFGIFFNSQDFNLQKKNENSVLFVPQKENVSLSYALISDINHFSQFQKNAINPIVSTEVEFQKKSNEFITSFKINTQDGGGTMLALLPDQAADLVDGSVPSVGEYKTIRGTQKLFSGNVFSFKNNILLPADSIDISILNVKQKETLKRLVSVDTKNLNFTKTDTYYTGKSLARAANLLDLAQQLEMKKESNEIRLKLKTELELWKNNTASAANRKNKYFYYDDTVRGVVGVDFSFGSELFNDHNFHYGYFIYSAAILSKYDSEYFDKNKNFINLLVEDIANTNKNNQDFPYLRGFDLYEGHSWASGISSFGDGNNQESSSEAVNAWYGTYLWSKEIKNIELENYSLWLYNREASVALHYWLNIDLSDDLYKNYSHSIVSLLWGGKVDWATWFDGAPESILGIQIIPINGGSLYLGEDSMRVERNLLGINFNSISKFKDYLIMYQSLSDSNKAERLLVEITDSQIDDGNSRSYLYAWVYYMQSISNK